VTERTDTLAPEIPMPTQKCAQWLVQVCGLYICAPPGHLNIAGVPRHHIHIQEHLQTIQEHKDQILSP